MMLLLLKNRTTNRPVVCICWRGRKGTRVFVARRCLKLSFTVKCSNAFGRLLGCGYQESNFDHIKVTSHKEKRQGSVPQL